MTDLLVGRALSPPSQPSIIKRAEDIALHTTELALQPTGPICFDSLACLQIAFLTFEYSLQLLVLPNHHWKQCFDNNCSCDTFKCTKSACFCAESTRSRTAIFTSWVWLFPSKHLGLFFFYSKSLSLGPGGGGTPYVMGDTYVPRFWPPFFTLAGSSTIFLGYFSHPPTAKLSFGVQILPIFTKIDLFGPKFNFFLDLFGSNFQRPAAHLFQPSPASHD